MALARASAVAAGDPLYAHLARLYPQAGRWRGTMLPVPMMNILNGGAHADSSVDFQEFMVMPLGAPSFAEALRTGAEIFHTLRGILKKKGYSTGVGDEGGFAPSLKSNREAVDVVLEAVTQAATSLARRCSSRSTSPSSEFWDKAGQRSTSSRSRRQGDASAEEMVALYEDWVRQYPIISIEDGLGRRGLGRLEDADRRRSASASSWSATMCSSPTRRSSRAASSEHVANALLVKLNQIGTVTETLDAVAIARDAGTPASFRIDPARRRTRPSPTSPSRTGAGQIKTGSASRTDRVAKYNQLLRIEEELGARGRYAGRTAITQLAR